MEALKKYGVYIILAFLVYVVGFLMLHNDLLYPITKAYDKLGNSEETKLWGQFFFSLGGLALTVLILKFLLTMEPFKDSMKSIFSDIFSEHKFLVGLDKEFLLKIAKNIHKANNDIIFVDKTQDNESVLKLKEYFTNNEEANKTKNYLVIESNYSTTLLASGIEIMHRKMKCKIINDGEFKHEYLFTMPNKEESLDYSIYADTKDKDRFTETSYNCMLKSSILNDGLSFKDILSNGKIGEDDAVSILFTKKHTVVGEILDIEFSISHPFKLTEEEDIRDYYKTTYSRPHAIRKIMFQIERYQEQKSNLIPEVSPVLYSNVDKLIKAKYTESIFYKTYSWEIFYSQDDCETISLNIE